MHIAFEYCLPPTHYPMTHSLTPREMFNFRPVNEMKGKVVTVYDGVPQLSINKTSLGVN